MLIEQDLEAKILAALSSALPATPKCFATGFWQPSALAVLKRVENTPDAVAILEVATSPAKRETFSVPVVTFDVTVALVVRLDLDPQGTAFAALAEAIIATFREWQAATYQQTFTALDVDGLSADDVAISATTPVIDTSTQTARLSWSLTISGTYIPETPSTPSTP